MKSLKGIVLIDCMLSMFILSLIVTIGSNLLLTKKHLVFDSHCYEMEEMWLNEDVKEIFEPKDESLWKKLIPEIITEEDIPAVLP